MPLDPANNLAETELTASVDDTATTLPVADASVFPDADSEGAFNVLVWDASANINPSDAPDAEFVRVTSVDTAADELTVERAQEDTSASAKESGSTVADTFSVKDRDDIDAGIAGKADDPHGSESHSSEVVHEGEDATFGDTTHDSVSTDSLPNTPTFDDGYQSDDEAVSKVHNGVVYAGHPDFSTLQEAIDFAEMNSLFGIQLPPESEFPNDATITENGVKLFSAMSGITSDNAPDISGALTIDARYVVINSVKLDVVDVKSSWDTLINNCSFSEINIIGDESTSFRPARLVGLSEGDITQESAADGLFVTDCSFVDITINGSDVVVKGLMESTVTDNGTNVEVFGNI